MFKLLIVPEAPTLTFLLRKIFPPTLQDYEPASAEQSGLAEDLKNSETSRRDLSGSSETEAPESLDWVTVDKPASVVPSNDMPAEGTAKLEEPDSMAEPKSGAGTSHITAETKQGKQQTDNKLLKDW